MTVGMRAAVLGLGLMTAAAAPPAPAAGTAPGGAPAPSMEGGSWRSFEPGLDWGEFPSPRPSDRGDSMIRALRIDPARFALRLMNASAPAQGRRLTARQWSARGGLVAAINASMYQTDLRRSVSLMRTPGHVNNSHLSRDRAVLAFDPLEPRLPAVALLDRDCDDFESLRGRYATLVQSIRMISCRGANVWRQQPRRWSAAAIGLDARGRILFLHARSPWSTHDLIDILLALPLSLTRAMYVEGGPEAQLYVRSGGEEHEWVGGFENGSGGADDNQVAWPVPNVVGVVRRGPAE